MIPILKTPKGYDVQLSRKQLDLVIEACESHRWTLAAFLLQLRGAPDELTLSLREEVRGEVKELKNIADGIKENLKVLDNKSCDENT